MSKIKLTEARQFIMEVIWSKEKAFMKDIMEAYDDPKPASTTLATVLKRMQDKNLVGYETVGNSRQYYSLVKKNNISVEKCKA
jgi:predicted transcriptional regulator